MASSPDSTATAALAVREIPCKHPPKRAPASAYDSKIMTVIVNDRNTRDLQKTFYVYRGVLDFYSYEFDCHVKADDLDHYELSNVSIDTFQMFYDWMYTGNALSGKAPVDTLAVDLFVFADFYGIPDLKIVALDMYFSSYIEKLQVDWSLINAIYKETWDDCRMRGLAVALVVETYDFRDFGWVVDDEKISKDIVVDVLETHRKKSLTLGKPLRTKMGKDLWVDMTADYFCKEYHWHANDTGWLTNDTAGSEALYQWETTI